MSDTTFSAGTVITSDWLNDANTVVYKGVELSSKYGTVADGTTDNTTTVLDATNGGAKVIIVPPNTKYNRTTVIGSMPTDVVIFDLSAINDYDSVTETCKHIGIVSKDRAEDDTHWSVDSGHHAIVALNNYGTAGTTSADERKGSIIWNAGQFQNGATGKQGFRGGAIFQFSQETLSPFWSLALRSLAPWTAIDGEYEYWSNSETIPAAGVVRANSASQFYVSTAAIASGGSEPTHTSGTVANWTWIDTSDRTVFGIDQYGRFGIGPFGSYNETFNHKVAVTDPGGGTYTFHGKANQLNKSAQLVLTPTKGTTSVDYPYGDPSPQPFLRAEHGAGLQVLKSDASSVICSFTDSGLQHGIVGTYSTASTLASAATIAPVSPITFVSGTAAIATLTVPTAFTSTGGSLTLIPTGIFTTTTAGNIALASTAVVGKALTMFYDAGTSKWYPSY
jgi:hypothetical protein